MPPVPRGLWKSSALFGHQEYTYCPEMAPTHSFAGQTRHRLSSRTVGYAAPFAAAILMGMINHPDNIVCQCFHVSWRKIETFCRVERPRTASAISECFSAGCGCGSCRPVLAEIHRRICGGCAEQAAECRDENASAGETPAPGESVG